MKKIIPFLIIAPFSLFGENLQELIALTKNNKMIDSSKILLESTKDSYESVKSGYLPSLNLGAGYSKNSYETQGYPDTSMRVQGSIDYVIYDGGKKGNTYDTYESNIKSQTESLASQKNEIALDVVNYYYNYQSYLAQKKAKNQQIEQMQAQYDRLVKFVDVGSATQDQVDQIISSIETAKVELNQIDLNLETINHNLEYILNKNVSIQTGSTIDEVVSNENKLRADLKAIEYQLESLKSTAKLQKSGNLPTVSFNNTYSYNDLNYDTVAVDTDYDRNVASLNLSWNIFDFGATKKSYEAAYKNYLALKSKYEYEKNKANVDLKLAHRAYDIGKLKVKSAHASVKAANSAYDIIKVKYEAGVSSNIEYLQALSDKFTAQSALKIAQYSLEINKANIVYYSGENIEEFIK